MPNLINIDNLLRTDTFNTWFVTTNEIIDALNPLNIYDVEEGSGIELITGTSDSGAYNGVVTISVDEGPGIDFDSQDRTIVGFRLYNSENVTLGPTGSTGTASAVVSDIDQFIVNDQPSVGATSGVAKAVMAGYMLPANIWVDPITFHGDVNIIGNFSVGGNDATIRANDLRIEDEQIELAYIEKVSFQITGATAGSFAAGQTAYYDDTSGQASGQTAALDAIGIVAAYQFVSGSTAYVEVRGPFDKGGVEDFELGGWLAASGSTHEFQVYTTPSLTSSFFTDAEYRNPPGIVVKGSQGDKEWTWDITTNAFLSNRGIGTESGTVYAWRFDSLSAYGASAGIFQFFSDHDTVAPAIRLYTSSAIGGREPGNWQISKPTTDYALQFAAGKTGNTPNVEYGFKLYPGFDSANLGQTFGGVGITAHNYAEWFNADQLDGAHGYTASTAWGIPIALSDGKIDPDWLTGLPYISDTISQTMHGFATGDCIRITTTGHYVKALATTPEYSETVGMISDIVDADTFVVTFSGKIDNLTNISVYPLTTGNVYFLSNGVAGDLISDPDATLLNGQVRKAMLLASGISTGFVLSYMGVIESETTDQVDISDLVPIGTIVPFSGSSVPHRWLLCNGYVYNQSEYPALFAVVGKTYGNVVRQFDKLSSSSVRLYFNADHGFTIADSVKLIFANGSTIDDCIITSVDSVNFTITLTKTNAFGSAYYDATNLTPTSYQGNTSTKFFVPNLAGRFAMGSGINDIDDDSATYTLGQMGGREKTAIGIEEIPSHAHTLPATVTVMSDINGTSVLSDSGSNNESGYSGGTADTTTLAHENRPPYMAVRYIIRAKPETDAFILTGHNHDPRYIRYDARHEEPSSNDLTETNRDTFRHNARVSGMPYGHVTTAGYQATGGTHNHHNAYVLHDQLYTLGSTNKFYARENINVWSKPESLYRYGTYNGIGSTLVGTLYWLWEDGGVSGYNNGNWAMDLGGDKEIVGVYAIGQYGGVDSNAYVRVDNGLTFPSSAGEQAKIGNVKQIDFISGGTIYGLQTIRATYGYFDQISANVGGNQGITFNSENHFTGVNEFTGTIYPTVIDFNWTGGGLKKIYGFNLIDGGNGESNIKNVNLSTAVNYSNATMTTGGIYSLAGGVVWTINGDNSTYVKLDTNVVLESGGVPKVTWNRATGNLELHTDADINWNSGSGGGTINNVGQIIGNNDSGDKLINVVGSRFTGLTGGEDDDESTNVDQVRKFVNAGVAVLDTGSLGHHPNGGEWEAYVYHGPEWHSVDTNQATFKKNVWLMGRVDSLTGSKCDTLRYPNVIMHMQFPMNAGDGTDFTLFTPNSSGGNAGYDIPSDEVAGTIEYSSSGTQYPYPSNVDQIHKAPYGGFSKYHIGDNLCLFIDVAAGPDNNTAKVKLAVGASDGSTIAIGGDIVVFKFVVGSASAYPGVF